jgi:hypothetical protein
MTKATEKSKHNLHFLNKSLGLDRKDSFSRLAMWRRYDLAWLIFFKANYVTKISASI